MNSLRIQQFQNKLKAKGIPMFLVSNFYNILYLTGFKGVSPNEREGYVIMTAQDIYFLTDGRYLTEAQKYFQDSAVVVCLISADKRLPDWIQEIASSYILQEIYFEKNDLKYSEYENLSKRMTLKGTDKLVEQQRVIKDQSEKEKIQQACKLVDNSLSDVMKLCKISVTEKEIAWKLEQWVRGKGNEIAFDPIVAYGSHSALPHYSPKNSSEKLTENTLILIDFGVKYKDYCSDITRMFYFGKPDDGLMNIYSNLLNIQEKTIDFVLLHPDENRDPNEIPDRVRDDNNSLKDIDKFVRDELQKHKLPFMPHSTGHGVGLEIHESPSVSLHSKDTLQQGQVFTVEPGIYIPGKYGMRIEDTIYLNNHHKAEILTHFPKSLTLLG